MEKKRTYKESVLKEYNQDQPRLLPSSLEEMIPQNHLVRTDNPSDRSDGSVASIKKYKGC